VGNIAQLLAQEAGESILCVKGARLRSFSQNTSVVPGDRTYCLIFAVYVGRIRIWCILSRDAMIARYIPPSCVRLCGVIGLVCSRHRTASTCSGRVHSLPWSGEVALLK